MKKESGILLLFIAFSFLTQAIAPAQSPVTNGPNDITAAVKKKTPPVTRISELAQTMQWCGVAVSEPDYYVWCTSPIAGLDGKIHLYCSRWPKIYKMDGWRTHCEIAHYVGDQPEGPFKFHDIAIPARPDALWNNTIHNPAIARVGGKYLLLYISFDRRPSAFLAAGKTPNYIGMCVADSPDGPWNNLTAENPLFMPSADTNHWSYGDWQCTNPTFLACGGKYYVYFHGGKHNGRIPSYAYAYAVADNPEGPYRLGDHWCTENKAKIEDATAFIWDNKICLLTDDNYGTHTGIPGAGLLWCSDSPTNFTLADAEIGFLSSTNYATHVDLSKVRKIYGRDFKFERPGILLLDGKPAYFYGASGFNLSGGETPESYVLKINLPAAKPTFTNLFAPNTRRIVFLGDSITYAGQYVEDVAAYVHARYPDRKLEFINVGLPSETVSGLSEPGHAGGKFPRPDLHERLARVLIKTKPDLVFACYGMNDGIYLPFDESRFKLYRDGINWLHMQIVGAGAKIVHLTPPVFDEAKGGHAGYGHVLDIYAEWLLGQRTNGWTVLDVHFPMKTYLADQRATNQTFALSRDGVHPDGFGHWLMAKAILSQLGVSEAGTSENELELLAKFPEGERILQLEQQQQSVWKDAWLTAIGHKRPGMKHGAPLEINPLTGEARLLSPGKSSPKEKP